MRQMEYHRDRRARRSTRKRKTLCETPCPLCLRGENERNCVSSVIELFAGFASFRGFRAPNLLPFAEGLLTEAKWGSEKVNIVKLPRLP